MSNAKQILLAAKTVSQSHRSNLGDKVTIVAAHVAYSTLVTPITLADFKAMLWQANGEGLTLAREDMPFRFDAIMQAELAESSIGGNWHWIRVA